MHIINNCTRINKSYNFYILGFGFTKKKKITRQNQDFSTHLQTS